MYLHTLALLASGGFLQRIPEGGLAILAAHLIKRALHQHVPRGGLALPTLQLTSLAILADRFAASLTILTGSHCYIRGGEIVFGYNFL